MGTVAGTLRGRSVVAVDDGRSVALITAPARRQAAVVDERLRVLPLALPEAG